MLRFTYETQMRVVEGQPGIDVRWERCRPGAKPLPFAHGYGARIWENDWRQKQDDGSFGEVYGRRPKWVAPQLDANLCLKGPYWPEAYRPGVPSREAGTFPALRREAGGGFSGCCTPAQFVPRFRMCNATILFPKRCRITVNPFNTVTLCAFANGKEFLAEHDPETGQWYAESEWNAELHLTAYVRFPVYPFGDNGHCYLEVGWLGHAELTFLFRLDQGDVYPEVTVNPIRYYWAFSLTPTYEFFTWLPCWFQLPPYDFPLGLVGLVDEV